MTTNLPEKLHAELGASSADRWMNCAGSVAMVRDIPNVDTPYTREGTAAHALIEKCLTLAVRPEVFLDTEINGVTVTEEMVESVQVMLDAVAAQIARDPEAVMMVEERFSLDALKPPAPMFGTSDVVLYLPTLKLLVVVDYKHGVGYSVAAIGNPQLRYYGLGALLKGHWTAAQVERIEVMIVQPRAAHPDGIVRSEVITFGELHDFAGELLAAADRAMAPNAPLTAGPWCRFCRAAARCPAKLAEAQALAQIEFAAETVAPPAPETLSMTQLLRVLEVAPGIEAWFRDVRTHIENTLVGGGEVPGYKLVAKRATRKWADETATKQWLDEQGYDRDEYLDQSLRSPAQIEKLVGKKALPADLVVKESSGYTVAPEYDKRPAFQPGSEFAALPPATP